MKLPRSTTHGLWPLALLLVACSGTPRMPKGPPPEYEPPPEPMWLKDAAAPGPAGPAAPGAVPDPAELPAPEPERDAGPGA